MRQSNPAFSLFIQEHFPWTIIAMLLNVNRSEQGIRKEDAIQSLEDILSNQLGRMFKSVKYLDNCRRISLPGFLDCRLVVEWLRFDVTVSGKPKEKFAL